MRNTNKSISESLQELKEIKEMADKGLAAAKANGTKLSNWTAVIASVNRMMAEICCEPNSVLGEYAPKECKVCRLL